MRYYKHKDFERKEENNLRKKTNRGIASLQEVECFLHDLEKVFKYVHLYKFLR